MTTEAREVEILPRDIVERIAHIVGPGSAAAQALECADRGAHGPNPVFCRPIGAKNDYLMVMAEEGFVRRGEDRTEATG